MSYKLCLAQTIENFTASYLFLHSLKQFLPSIRFCKQSKKSGLKQLSW